MKLKHFLIILFALLTSVGFSQITEEQEELIETAEEHFYEGRFKEAMPLYSQLLSLYPTEAIYSFYYGSCLVENNKEIDKAIKYLSYAAKKLENQPLVFYYLGRAYHLSYHFDKAIQQYQEFQAKSNAKQAKEKQAEREINICNNGLDLVKYASPLVVLENKKTKESNFQYAYKLDDIGGKLVLKPDQFKTKADLKKNEKELLFISDSGMVLFSSLGENRYGDKDLYWADKDANGAFLPSKNLGDIINTRFDEDYPFLKADGKTLYFCSKGHNTMGGYDIFRSVFDSTINAWTAPENLDFPTNTPYDDLLYVVDAEDNLAYFASNRESQEEKLNIYKIQVDHNPIERSVSSVEEIIEIAKLEVSPLADNKTTKDTSQLAVATTEVADYQAQGPKTDFSFEEVYENNINSSEAYTSVLRNDIKILEKTLEQTEAKQILATNIAHQKLGKLREIQSQINDIESNSDPIALLNNSEYKTLQKEANKINTQAQIAVEINQKLNTEITNRNRELNITELLLNDSANNSTQELVQNINANRKFLEANNKTYLSIINKKREKEQDKGTLIKSIDTQKNTVEKSLQNLNLLIADYQDAEKQGLNNDLPNFKSEVLQSKQILVSENKKLKSQELELAKTEEEIRFLDQLNGELNSFENQKLASTNQTFDQKLISDNAQALNQQIVQMNKSTYELEVETIFNDAIKNVFPEEALLAKNNKQNDTSEEAPEKDKESNQSPEIETELANQAENNPEQITLEATPGKEIVETNPSETSPSETVNNKTIVTPKEMVEVSLVSVKSLKARRLFFDAKRDQQLSDSLSFMAQEKQQRVNYIPNQEQQDIVHNEIEELNQLSKIKSQQAKQNYTKAKQIEDAYLAQNPSDSIIDDFINKGLMAYETGQDENPEYIEYKKAAFTEHYYQQVLSSNKAEASLSMQLLNNNDLSDERRSKLENKLNRLEQSKENINQAIRKAQETQNLMKATLVDEFDILPQSQEEILVASTNLDLSSKLKLSKAQLKANKSVLKNREEAQNIKQQYSQKLEELNTLEDSLSLVEDIDLREDLSFEIEELKENTWSQFRKANELAQFSNMEERGTLDQLIIENRKYSNSDAISKAYLYEKESEVLDEKASYLRNNNNPNLAFKNSTITNLEKANLYELAAINRKKAALEIYASIPEMPDANLIAENNSAENKNIEPETQAEKAQVIVELLPDEEERLAEYKKIYAQSEAKQTKAENYQKDLEKEKAALERTYIEKDKKKQVSKISELEAKTKLAYQDAYRTHLNANSKKQKLYNEKIDAALNQSKDKTNKALAKQYTLDAEFYFEEAAKIEVDSTENIFNLKAKQEQRLSLENKALSSQELAYSALIQAPEADFLTSSGFIKIEPIEQNEKPIDPNIIQKVQTQRILDRIDISPEEAKRLSKTDKLKDEKTKLEEAYLLNKKEIDLLNDSLPKVTDAKVWKKMDGQISKLEQKSLSYLFSIAATSEPIHYERYMLYKDRISNYRIKDKSEQAVNGRNLEKAANKAFRKAQNLRSGSFEVVSVDKAYDMLSKAQALEQEAIDDIEKAYTIYLDLKPLEEDVANYLAENTDTNTVDEFGNTLIESEGQVEAYKTPEIIEVEPVLSNDTTLLVSLNKTDTLNNQTPTDTLLTEETQPTDSNIAENREPILEEPVETNELIVEETPENNNTEETLSIEETNALIARLGQGNENETISENATEIENETEVTATESTEINNEIPVETPTEVPVEVPVETTEEIAETEVIETPVENNETQIETEEVLLTEQRNEPISTEIVYDIDNGKPAFKMLSQAAYSNTNPIPVDRKLPNGIVYKIQIGAFTKPIPQTSFKGLTPITGETRQNSKYVRYFVGLFDTYEAADIVLPHIQRNGYRDAFIVAYRNGQRIGVYIAKREDSQAPDYNTVAQIEKQAVLKIINENAEQTLGKGATLVDLEPLNPSVNLTEVKTTMYTVQIGVYKRHVAHERLYNLSPLYNDLTKSGLIRYTVGQFVDYNQAIQKRNEIRQKGIRDAFVTAYRNGERISITTARKALANVSANTQTEIEPAIVKETTEPEVAPTKTPVTSTPTYNTDQLHYCVQIGAYSNSVPVSIVSSFVQLSKLDELDNFKTDNGQTVYTIGNFKSLSRANLLKQDLVEQGITDAFIIAFDGKNKVAISEAQKVLKP